MLVLAIVFGCFGILWPKLLSPMLSGETPVPVKTDEDGEFIFVLPQQLPCVILNSLILIHKQDLNKYYSFTAISSNRDHSNPSRGGQMGAPHPVMGEGQGKRVPSAVPPLPVRTIDKEWKAKVSICKLSILQ